MLGCKGDEILNVNYKEPLIDNLMKGVGVNFEAKFLKNIQKVISKQFEGKESPLGDMIKMFGPAFGFSSNFSTEVEYDSFEELKQHPMAETLLISLDTIV